MAGPRAVACARSGRGLRSRHAPSGPDRRDAASVVTPAAAHAAAVRLDPTPDEGRTPASRELVFDAAPGEANRLTVPYDGSGFDVDDVVPVTPGANCHRPVATDLTRVRCDGSDGGDATIRLATRTTGRPPSPGTIS